MAGKVNIRDVLGLKKYVDYATIQNNPSIHNSLKFFYLPTDAQ